MRKKKTARQKRYQRLYDFWWKRTSPKYVAERKARTKRNKERTYKRKLAYGRAEVEKALAKAQVEHEKALKLAVQESVKAAKEQWLVDLDEGQRMAVKRKWNKKFDQVGARLKKEYQRGLKEGIKVGRLQILAEQEQAAIDAGRAALRDTIEQRKAEQSKPAVRDRSNSWDGWTESQADGTSDF